MKDELLKQLIDIIQQTKDFTLEQMPIVAREIVRYGIITNTLAAIFLWLLLFVGWSRSYKKMKQTGEDMLIGTVILGIPAMIIFLMAMYTTDYAIKAICAPRLYIIDQLKGR